jgi:hypothetical protein
MEKEENERFFKFASAQTPAQTSSMRIGFVPLILLSCLGAKASQDDLPKATLTANSMGGDVLMLDGGHTLSIDGDTNEKLIKELGEIGKKNFFRDMILAMSAENLKKTYGAKNHPTALSIIGKYQILGIPVATPAPKSSPK